MKATFENTVDILVKAYLNDTLEHENCFACAVGNIVAYHKNVSWGERQRVFIDDKMKCWNGEIVTWYSAMYNKDSQDEQIVSTGYSVDQIRRIERAFETVEKPDFDGHKGLMAVVDVLADIHGISLEQKSEAKAMFVKETIMKTKP